MRQNKVFKLNSYKVLSFGLLAVWFLTGGLAVSAQKPAETPPPPGEPSAVKIPAVKESSLKNGLSLVVVERKNVPLVTVKMLIRSGANRESPKLAGLADMTATLLRKGTASRTADEIAEQIEFLGGSLNTGADWNSTEITVSVMSDKLEPALEIMADAMLNPAFSQSEIDLYKKQVLDNLRVRLKQPGTLGNYVATRYSFGEHVAAGTPESIARITREDIKSYHKKFYTPWDSVLIFSGDIAAKEAVALGEKYFSDWKGDKKKTKIKKITAKRSNSKKAEQKMDLKDLDVVRGILVIDLPKSGQASVSFATRNNFGREGMDDFYTSSVLNSLLGGGYSARLNQEIRIKRGLSYGARSNFDYRIDKTNFIATTQTKNESAAEVADLIRIEIERLSREDIGKAELTPRQAVLTGSFGRRMETNNGLANLIADLYLFELETEELNRYMDNVRNVSGEKIKQFAIDRLLTGDLILVGDASVFMDELKKRFPNDPISVIPAEELDLNSPGLKKSDKSADRKRAKPKKKVKTRGKSDADRSDN